MFVLTGHHGGLVGPAVILVFPLAGLQLLPNSLSYAEMQSPRALAQSPQPPVFYPSAQALLCYHYFSGAKPTHVYLAGIGLGSTGLYPSVICGTWLMGMSILRT